MSEFYGKAPRSAGGFGRRVSGQGIRMAKSVMVFALSAATAVVVMTGAIFTDTQSVGSNTFSTGTVDISTTPTSAIVSFSGMAPGDSVVDDVTVTNGGSLQLRYALKSTTTGSTTLPAQLDMTVWDEAAEADAGSVCATTAPATVLYGPADLGAAAGANVVGDPTQGNHTGDRVLAAAASELLCFKVLLPLATGNTYQNLTTTATLDFVSEQTVNNA